MVDLSTSYLGLNLRTPLVVSPSPLSEDIATIKHMEDAGASAVVLYSLFEEQIVNDQLELHHHLTHGTDSFAEATTYFPEPSYFHVGPEGYLKHIQKAKEAVDIPVIASLNGTSIGGWTSFAKQIEQAGADAMELNIYYIPTDMNMSSADVEQTYVDILTAVKATVKIPVAVKISPFFSNMANMAKRLDDAGANALVLFNRFYQPDVDLELLEVRRNVLLSTPQAQRLPLTWIGILYGRIQAQLAATSGVHNAEDSLKMLMVGATVTMMASILIKNGIDHIKKVESDMVQWLEEHEYVSVTQMRGSMSQMNSANPGAFERAQYIRAVSTLPDRYRNRIY